MTYCIDMLKLLSIFVLLQSLTDAQQLANFNSRQIIIMLRHGSSAPLKTYPRDTYGPTYWDRFGGLGQITPRGLLQSYNFGQFIKNYFNNFLTPAYNPNRVYVRSVDVDRSLMSTHSFLAGMYPPANSDQLWSSSVTWFPIPVHTTERRFDQIFVDKCDKYDNLIRDSTISQEYRNLVNQYTNLVRNISSLSGINNMELNDLTTVYDSTMAKMANNLPLESWITEYLPNITAANRDITNFRYGTMEKAQLVAGALLYDIVTNLRRKTTGSTNEVYVYSSQDEHINAMSTLLNLTPLPERPSPYGSALIFELLQNNSGLYFLRIFNRNNSINDPTNLQLVKMNECDTLCPLGNFFSLTLNRLVTNLSDTCYAGPATAAPPTQNPTTSYTYINQTLCPNNTWFYNNTIDDFGEVSKDGLSKLELTLIIISSALGGFALILLITIGLMLYRYRIRRTIF